MLKPIHFVDIINVYFLS